MTADGSRPILGLAIACLLNADAIHIAGTLYRDPALRDLVAQQASAIKGPVDPSAASKDLASLPLPRLGRPKRPLPRDLSWQLPLKILGIVLTASAVALGAPFWFDALSRLGSLRSTGPTPKPSTDD